MSPNISPELERRFFFFELISVMLALEKLEAGTDGMGSSRQVNGGRCY